MAARGGAVATTEPGWGFALIAVAAVTLWRIAELAAWPVNLSFDEAQYWSWAQDPAFGYFSKPPVVAWAIAATTALFGSAEWAVRMGSPLAHAGTALALFALGRRIGGGRVGLISALLMLTLPGVSVSALLISTDPFLMCAWGWGLYALYSALTAEAEGRPALRAWIGVGLAFGCGLLAKYAMIAFPVGAALAAAWVPEWRGLWRRRGPWLALGLGFAVFSPNLAWNAAHHFVSFAHTQANANLSAGGVHPLKALAFLGGQFAVFGPIPFVALLILAFGLLARRRPAAGEPLGRDVRFLAAFALPLLAVMTVEGFLSRANANWAAPVYVSATVWVAAACAKREGWLKAAFALHLLAALLIVNYDAAARLIGVEMTARTDPMKRLRGWDRLGLALADAIRPETVGGGEPVLVFDERKILTPMLYYLPRPHPEIAKWNADGHIDDHYDLTADLARHRGRSVLLATRKSDVSAYAGAFEGPVVGPMILSVPIHKDYALTLNLFRMGRFTGYPEGGVPAPRPAADD
jgi:4-amino-4-deoxy-L-arabinose transferase-like glycosyltransferase